MDGSKQKEQEVLLHARGRKPLWQRPTLAFLGKLRDLVQGGGKTGDTRDADPQGTYKQGTG